MHGNSIAAFNMLDIQPRQRAVLNTLICGRILTDRQIAYELGFTDPNATRPRITRLLELGILEECGNTKDETTGRTVRLVRIKPAEGRLF